MRLQEKLDDANIPYRIVRETSLLDRAAVKDVLAYLDLLRDSDMDSAFLRVYNTPRRRLGKAIEQRLLIMQDDHISQGRRVSLFQCAKELAASGELGAQQAKSLKGFVTLIENLKEDIMALRPAEIIDRVIEHSGYISYIKEQEEKKRKKKLAEENGGEGSAAGQAEEDDDEEEEDFADSDDDKEEEKEEDADSNVEEAGTDAGNGVVGNTSNEKNGKQQKPPTAAQWPYNFKCTLKGKGAEGCLLRLRNEAIRWVNETHEPRLGVQYSVRSGFKRKCMWSCCPWRVFIFPPFERL